MEVLKMWTEKLPTNYIQRIIPSNDVLINGAVVFGKCEMNRYSCRRKNLESSNAKWTGVIVGGKFLWTCNVRGHRKEGQYDFTWTESRNHIIDRGRHRPVCFHLLGETLLEQYIQSQDFSARKMLGNRRFQCEKYKWL